MRLSTFMVCPAAAVLLAILLITLPAAVDESGISPSTPKFHIPQVHFDTAAQGEVGTRYAEKFFQLTKSS